MKFDQHLPTELLRNYISHYIIAENIAPQLYKVFPSQGLVIGFQYLGKLLKITPTGSIPLHSSGVTGITDTYLEFQNAENTGTVLVYFTEIGFTHFCSTPAHELFNQSVGLELLFDRRQVEELEDKLSNCFADSQRIRHVDQFFKNQLKQVETDRLIVEAVRQIYASKGAIRIQELIQHLGISQSPFEKRFRKLVGTSPKKFASIVRFNTVLNSLDSEKSLTDICYENHFFDQAHFIKDFKRFTGDTPEQFKNNSK